MYNYVISKLTVQCEASRVHMLFLAKRISYLDM